MYTGFIRLLNLIMNDYGNEQTRFYNELLAFYLDMACIILF